MAHTGIATQGFECVGMTTDQDVMYLPGDPGVTFTRGDSVTFSNGVLVSATAGVAPMFTVLETVTCPAATVAAPRANDVNKVENASADNCLVQVKPLVSAGWPIHRVTFAQQHDDDVAAYTAATPSLTLTVSPGADNDTNGAIIYVYEGPGAGEILIGADYTHTSLVLTTHRIPNTALTTDSKVIVLEGEGGGVGGIPFFGRVDSGSTSTIDVNDGYDDGDWLLYFDWHQAAGLMKDLQLLVIPARAMF